MTFKPDKTSPMKNAACIYSTDKAVNFMRRKEGKRGIIASDRQEENYVGKDSRIKVGDKVYLTAISYEWGLHPVAIAKVGEYDTGTAEQIQERHDTLDVFGISTREYESLFYCSKRRVWKNRDRHLWIIFSEVLKVSEWPGSPSPPRDILTSILGRGLAPEPE